MAKLGKPRETAAGRKRAVDAHRGENFDLSVVFATSDDAPRIGVSLKRVATFLKHANLSAEVLIVDDASRDSIEQIVAPWNDQFEHLRLVRNDSRRGMGAAARAGLLLAEGRHVLLAEVGLAAPIEDAPALLECLEAGAGVAIASRSLDGASVRSPRPAGRRTAEAMYSAAARLLVPLGTHDLFSGLIAFHCGAARRIAERARLERATFAVEWIALAERMGLQVIECPVRFSHNASSKDTLSWTDFARIDDLWKVRSLVKDVRAPMPQPPAKLLHETSFVRLDHRALYGTRIPLVRR